MSLWTLMVHLSLSSPSRQAGKTASMQAKTIDIQRTLSSINGPQLLAAAEKGDAAAMTKLFEKDTWLDYQDAVPYAESDSHRRTSRYLLA